MEQEKMEQKKIFSAWKWMLLILAAVCLFQVKPVKAAGFTRLGLNRTYTAYDVTGDGKRDRIRIATSGRSGYFSQVRVIINGRNRLVKKFSYSAPTVVRFRICNLSNRKPFLFMECMGDSLVENTACLYQYSGGSLKTVLNLRNMLSRNYFYKYYFDVKRVSGNTITFLAGGQAYNTGVIDFDMSFVYRGGRFVRTSTTTRLAERNIRWGGSKTNTYTVARRFQTYQKAGSRVKAFAPMLGERVKITHICIRNKVPYFRIVDSRGRAGWMNGINSSYYSRVVKHPRYYCYFREATIVG